jgi:hypothetical protein
VEIDAEFLEAVLHVGRHEHQIASARIQGLRTDAARREQFDENITALEQDGERHRKAGRRSGKLRFGDVKCVVRDIRQMAALTCLA